MPPLRDEDELLSYKSLLEVAERFTDFIIWKREPAEQIHKHLSNYLQRDIELLICKHREEVCQTKDGRGFVEPYHYDFRIPIDGERIYIETVFHPGTTTDDSRILIVRVKPADPSHIWIG